MNKDTIKSETDKNMDGGLNLNIKQDDGGSLSGADVKNNLKEDEETAENRRITSRKEDYSKWYSDVIAVADLADNSPVRGCMVIKPNGYAIW